MPIRRGSRVILAGIGVMAKRPDAAEGERAGEGLVRRYGRNNIRPAKCFQEHFACDTSSSNWSRGAGGPDRPAVYRRV
jgi:hypothetical protein